MIKVYILCKDHTAKMKSVNSKKDWFEFNNGWYNLDRKYGLHEKDDTTYYYLEGNPQPINCKEDSIRFLETIGFKSLIYILFMFLHSFNILIELIPEAAIESTIFRLS